MEASLQTIANMLKSEYEMEALCLFRIAAEKAEDVFGYSDERTVWCLVTIGIVFQTYRTWDKARDWFE